jgi:hypothetical protein
MNDVGRFEDMDNSPYDSEETEAGADADFAKDFDTVPPSGPEYDGGPDVKVDMMDPMDTVNGSNENIEDSMGMGGVDDKEL